MTKEFTRNNGPKASKYFEAAHYFEELANIAPPEDSFETFFLNESSLEAACGR